MQERSKHGGARPGAGLKRGTILVPPEKRARKVCLSIRSDLFEQLAIEAERQDATIPATIVAILEKNVKKRKKT